MCLVLYEVLMFWFLLHMLHWSKLSFFDFTCAFLNLWFFFHPKLREREREKVNNMLGKVYPELWAVTTWTGLFQPLSCVWQRGWMRFDGSCSVLSGHGSAWDRTSIRQASDATLLLLLLSLSLSLSLSSLYINVIQPRWDWRWRSHRLA